MFSDEINKKLNLTECVSDFVVCVYGGNKVAVEGIKTVSYLSENEIRFKTRHKIVSIKGDKLCLSEAGGGVAYVSGEVKSFEIV